MLLSCGHDNGELDKERGGMGIWDGVGRACVWGAGGGPRSGRVLFVAESGRRSEARLAGGVHNNGGIAGTVLFMRGLRGSVTSNACVGVSLSNCVCVRADVCVVFMCVRL